MHADISEVAADLRNQGSSVVIAVCSDDARAEQLARAFGKDPFGTCPRRTHGNGERPPKELYQEKFLYCYHGRIVVAGRSGMVKDVTVKSVTKTPLKGYMLIAEVDFSVGVHNALQMRVVAIVAESTVVEKDDIVKDWTCNVEELLQRSVRVLCFKDSEEDFRNTLLRWMQTHTNVRCLWSRSILLRVGAH